MSTTTSTTSLKRLLSPARELSASAGHDVAIRFAQPVDVDAIERVAQLDSRRAPRGPVLVAEVGDELWAAISLDDRHTVADPFRPTGALVALLVERARQLQRSERKRRGALPRVWPKTGYDHPAWS